jgi:AraC-like DNA-binding protein
MGKAVTWSTQAVGAKTGLDHWNELIGTALLELQIASSEKRAFNGVVRWANLGCTNVHFVSAQADQSGLRTRQAIARSGDQNFFLIQLHGGACAYKQRGREAELRAGDSVLVDSKEIFSFCAPLPTDVTVLRMPQAWLRAWMQTPEDAVARRIDGSAGWGRAVSATISSIDLDAVDELALPGGVVAEQIAALLTLVCSPKRPESTSRRLLMNRIRQSMRDHCYDETLGPADIAALHNISIRYLFALFAHEMSTFSAELTTLRLDRATRMLVDQTHAKQTITEIAMRCGFADASHFARKFRQQYKTTPRGVRKAAGF